MDLKPKQESGSKRSQDAVFPWKIGIIAGAFDVLHPGYIQGFKEAKQHCDHLIVCVHVDPTLENPQKLKPVLRVEERIEILEAVRYVDEVRFYRTENDFLRLLKLINPDIRFLGQDYEIGLKAITGAELNIPIHFLNRDHGWSATKLKQMIAKSLENSSCAS